MRSTTMPNRCQCQDYYRAACEELGLPPEHEYEGKRYCILHLPSGDKDENLFLQTIEAKLASQRPNFNGVHFPSSIDNFHGFTFREEASFIGSTFHDTADFSNATFERRVYFDEATFKGPADFDHTTFSEKEDLNLIGESSFAQATFEQKASFWWAVFTQNAVFKQAVFRDEVNFTFARFKELADFSFSHFERRVSFDRPTFSDVTFYYATFDGLAGFFGGPSASGEHKVFSVGRKVSFEQASASETGSMYFAGVPLRPSWFINVDKLQQLPFRDVEWHRLTAWWKVGRITDEIRIAKGRHHELAEVCRALADNVQERQHDYVRAAEFRYWSRDIMRREGRWHGITPWKVDWWYWAMCGYGERPIHALLVLGILWVLFALIYMVVPFPPVQTSSGSIAHDSSPLGILQALVWSLGAMTRLVQGPDNPSEYDGTELAQIFVFLEGILGPLQIGLLLLSVRRRLLIEHPTA